MHAGVFFSNVRKWRTALYDVTVLYAKSVFRKYLLNCFFKIKKMIIETRACVSVKRQKKIERKRGGKREKRIDANGGTQIESKSVKRAGAAATQIKIESRGRGRAGMKSGFFTDKQKKKSKRIRKCWEMIPCIAIALPFSFLWFLTEQKRRIKTG